MPIAEPDTDLRSRLLARIESKLDEVWTPGDAFPGNERDRITWQPEGAGAPFTLPLQELFRAIG